MRTHTPDAYALSTQEVSETAETLRYLKPVFFGEPVNVPPHPADKPLPAPPRRIEPLASTLDERTPQRRVAC
jgi:hypothetical protein